MGRYDMICQEITIQKYKWDIKVLFDIDCNSLELVEQELLLISCPRLLIDEALDNFKDCGCNKGLTYSNGPWRKSLILIGKTSSIQQLLNTTIHEAYHFISQLACSCNIQKEEECASLIGDLIMQLSDILIQKII